MSYLWSTNVCFVGVASVILYQQRKNYENFSRWKNHYFRCRFCSRVWQPLYCIGVGIINCIQYIYHLYIESVCKNC
jgi:hypothetical protein